VGKGHTRVCARPSEQTNEGTNDRCIVDCAMRCGEVIHDATPLAIASDIDTMSNKFMPLIIYTFTLGESERKRSGTSGRDDACYSETRMRMCQPQSRVWFSVRERVDRDNVAGYFGRFCEEIICTRVS